MYHKMSEDCKESLKKQFEFSMLELEQMERFMSRNMKKTAKDLLETLMKDDSLNDRQKVIVSYTIGASVGAEDIMQELENIQNMKEESRTNIRIGQGG